MNLSNSLNLPEALVTAIQYDDYDKPDADFSVTELISPPRIAILRQRHSEHIVSDASDRIFSLFGKAIHVILERAASDRYLVEKRFFLTHDGYKIGGRIDIYDKETKVLSDWKITSRHTVNEGPKKEWIAQGNLNTLILRTNGYEVKKIQYVAIFRDWSKLMAYRKKDYPEHQVKVLDIPIWREKETELYLSQRILAHLEARTGELPLCSPEERWSKPTRFALMQKGKKRAIKLFDTKEEAWAAVSGNKDRFVEKREGEETRCLHYCEVCPWCDFGREVVLAANPSA